MNTKTKILRQCEHCGKTLGYRQKRFCSTKCTSAHYPQNLFKPLNGANTNMENGQKQGSYFRDADVATPRNGMRASSAPDGSGWLQYALNEKTEQLRETRDISKKLQEENEKLKERIHEFEKTIIGKDNEIAKISESLTSSQGMSGIVKQALGDPEALKNLIGAIPSLISVIPAILKPRPSAGDAIPITGTADDEAADMIGKFGAFISTKSADYRARFWSVLNFFATNENWLDRMYRMISKNKPNTDENVSAGTDENKFAGI